MSALALLARLCPVAPDPGADRRRAMAFLGWTTSPERLVRAGYGLGVLGAVLAAAGYLLAPAGLRLPLGSGLALLALLGVQGIHQGPTLLATARRTSALGDAPDLVARAVLRMHLAPAPERAAAFAADDSGGPLARNLHRHVRRAGGRPRSGLETFGAEWDEWFPSLRRSLALVEAAGAAPEADRPRLLERALAVVLDGTTDTMRSFADSIRGPAAGLYAFGVLLPLALVALLPAAHTAGLVVTPLTVGLVYDVALPAILVAASAWLLANRPVAFRPPAVTSAHPDVPDRRRQGAVAGLATATAGWVVASRFLPAWGAPVAAVGLGSGVALWVIFAPVTAVYDRIGAAEAGLTNALELVGRRVANGHAVEAAVADAADELDDELGEVMRAGVAMQRRLNTDFETAFLGRNGALSTLPSPRLRSSFELLAVAAREGAPAGEAVLALADHVDDLQAVERDARHSLDSVCGTLQSTGAVFGPLVAGATVALADTMASGGSLLPGGASGGMPWLGLAVGWYVLAMAAVLTTLATGLTRGLDGPLVGYRVGRALVVATLAFLGSYAVAGALA